MNKRQFILGVLAVTAITAVAWSQEKKTDQANSNQNPTRSNAAGQNAATPNRNDPAGRGSNARHENDERHIAACLILGNQNEIAQAQLAETRSSSQKVKEFAKQMREEHGKFLSDLQRYSGNQFSDRLVQRNDRQATEGGDASKSRNTTSSGTQPASAPQQAGRTSTTQREGVKETAGQTHDVANAGDRDGHHLRLHQEIADECLASAQRELSDKQGTEFDTCYVDMQVAEHQRMISELKVFERHASGDFQALLSKGRTTAEHHLQHAKQFKKELEGGPSRKSE